MKITSFYYLAYPDSLPSDGFVAASEVYLEVSETEGSLNVFDITYSIHVYTVGFLQQQVKEKSFFATRPAIVVDCFDDSSIKAALEAILPKINEIAERK